MFPRFTWSLAPLKKLSTKIITVVILVRNVLKITDLSLLLLIYIASIVASVASSSMLAIFNSKSSIICTSWLIWALQLTINSFSFLPTLLLSFSSMLFQRVSSWSESTMVLKDKFWSLSGSLKLTELSTLTGGGVLQLFNDEDSSNAEVWIKSLRHLFTTPGVT